MSDSQDTQNPAVEGSQTPPKNTPPPEKPKSAQSKKNDDVNESQSSENNENQSNENNGEPVEGEENDQEAEESLNESPIPSEEEDPEEPLPEYMKRLVQLPGLNEEMWNESHELLMNEFLTRPTKRSLVFYINDLGESSELIVQNEMPTNPQELFTYFTKNHYSPEINNKELFHKNVQFGSFSGKHLTSLLRLTSGLYAPLFFGNETWPDSIKSDFSGQLHRFLASLTDTRWKMEGVTVLYIPKEGSNMDLEVASKNKELVQRLDSTVIHWSRQLKDVLNSQDMSGLDETAGPLEEIDFWKAKSLDLTGISKQLNKSSVKRITKILQMAKSSYVGSFIKLAKQIQDGSKQAENNLQFLTVLKDPCHDLADTKPVDIPKALPRIINIIRVIWTNSDYYNTPDRLNAMFRKLSNEVIRRCCASINLDMIFDGFVVSSKKSLNECIDCCNSWKDIYNNIQKVHQNCSNYGWSLDKTAIFAQIDAFIQRCRDLMDICDCEVHFANADDGEKKQLPIFGGQKGPEIARNLYEIESTFNKHLLELRRVKESILDVKATSWHEDYNRFRSAVKEMEVMVINVINAAFDTVTYVEQAVEILDAFMHLSARESIRRTIDKKTVDTYLLFIDDLNTVKREITSRAINLDPMHPDYSGAAMWAKGLKRRIEKQMTLLNMAHFLPSTGVGEDSRTQYKQTCHALDEFIRKCFTEWTCSLDNDPLKLLESPLLKKSSELEGMIDVNLSPKLLKLIAEIHYWERLDMEIPSYCSDVFSKREELMNLRENVLTVIQDYNRIIGSLSYEERGLFKERIKNLDKRIQPGFNKLTWTKPQAAEEFITTCRRHAGDLQVVVDRYKSSLMQCFRLCKQISENLLVKIDSRKIFENLEFEADQMRHRRNVSDRLSDLYDSIEITLKQTHEIFKKDDSDEVRNQWSKLIDKMYRMLEEAFRLNVKNSLLELSKAINGDGKSAPNPLFKVQALLESFEENIPSQFGSNSAQQNSVTKYRLNFGPTLDQIAHLVNSIGQYHLTDSISSITKPKYDIFPRNKSPIYLNISRDEEKLKIEQQINTGMENNAKLLDQYLTTWLNNFRELWEVNKDSFLLRYEQRNPAVSIFDGDIARYTEVENNIQNQETIQTIQFILLDCSPLKFSLLGHCQEWQNRFTSLLLKLASQTLNKLIANFDENTQKVMIPPETHYDLDKSNKLLETLQNNLAAIEDQFIPLNTQFDVLQKYEVSIPDETREQLKSLPMRWEAYNQTLIDAEDMLKKNRERFKAKLLQQSDEFKKNVSDLVADFKSKGPFSADIKCEDALKTIEEMSLKLNGLKEEELELRKGLGIFKIDHAFSKDIQNVEADIQAIKKVWELVKDWEDKYNGWKLQVFNSLETQEMDDYAGQEFKKLVKMAKEYRDKEWDVVEVTKNKVDRFKRTMPLVGDLHNKAMRERHWNQIKEESNKQFNESGEDFTLEAIIDLHFEENTQLINEVSEAASKEFDIEKGLKSINEKWEVTVFETAPHKDKGHFKIKSTEDVMKAIEDDQVMLSTFKASRFVKPFIREVDRWEREISKVLEITESILTVQRQWLYLENIFAGEDIRNQLPKETVEFENLNNSFKVIMTRIDKDPNAFRATHYEGLDKQAADMNTRLEEIQKSLDMYLETKKVIFPRFYFISNDDLLEILGQSKNPPAVQQHLKKLFDNIKSLKLQKSAIGNKTEALSMFSSEGEEVPFMGPLTLEGPVEAWLCDVESTMRSTLKDLLKNCKIALKKNLTKRDKWIKEWPGQLCITASQMQWTADCTRALQQVKSRGDKKPLKSLKKKQTHMLNKFSEIIRSNLPKMLRLKIVALVTIEIHARDVIEKLAKANCNDVNGFDWLMQLRVYWDKELDDCLIKQTTTEFQYGYEYLGNSGRLVITPLTDRCYMTLTTALQNNRGGSPKGPAGTGKTETVKDLGKSLGVYVIVINCSEGLDYQSMGRNFSGLAQTGAWGCFDEFNRINIEVLSVVAQQILAVIDALTSKSPTCNIEKSVVKLIPSCGIFITMNPGYAGRTELPDNLKSMFRPISMCVPDSNYIAEILLFGEGFNNTRVLAKKVYTLYSLSQQQLSKQDHYDFGLRALSSVLRHAGKIKRANPTMTDEEILLLGMKDMNVPKMTTVDLPLFNAIVSDLFPGIEPPQIDYVKFKKAIETDLLENNYQVNANAISKVIQLYETKNSRHSVMMVGKTQSGKTVSWQTLKNTLTRLNNEGEPGYEKVQEYTINPKSVSLGELYGEFDLSTNEWSDGILSSVMRTTCADPKPDQKWIFFDSPVDAVWIESMNSVMDDNKILTLINSERIAMPDQVSLLFETENLEVASPATVSRCGMVYCDYLDLGYESHLESWIQTKKHKAVKAELKMLIEKYVKPILEFKRKNCKELVPIAELNGIKSMCKLFDVFGTSENGVEPSGEEYFARMTEMWFLFCVIWSIGASVDEDGRKRIDAYIRELEGTFPNKDSVFEYYVDTKQRSWVQWEETLRSGWKYDPNIPFYKIIVPTVDTVRYNFLVSNLIKNQCPVLLCGPVGTGKTSVAVSVLGEVDPMEFSSLIINISAQTTSNLVQEIIESRVEKRTKGVFVPIGGKKMINFIDDFNMPAKDFYGSQPPLELIRLWLDWGFWYDRKKQTTRHIKDVLLMASMGPPGGGRTVISKRLQSRFNLINMTFPSDTEINRIFGSMINQKLADFEDEFKSLGDMMTKATIQVYESVIVKFLPTPTKIHYLFNLRDISKVFQGLLRCEKKWITTKPTFIRLWIHECFRVFSDRLVDDKDREAFIGIISENLGSIFDQTYHNICEKKIPPIFADFLNQDGSYEDLVEFPRLKNHMEKTLEEYNEYPGQVPMDIVLFRDAIEHVCRAVRVLRQPKGNMLLIGIGGSGRQSLSKLASFICMYTVFQIEVSKNYKRNEFREDLKKLYAQAGIMNKETTFILVDTQIAEESFLEDINNILSSGEVPNLYKNEEFEEIKSNMTKELKKHNIEETNNTAVYDFLLDRVKANLHVIVCMSPVGEPFRNRMRMFPALVNCTTIDLFNEWPQEALLEVGEKYLANVELGVNDQAFLEECRTNIAQMFSIMHKSVSDQSKKMYLEIRRSNYVTPTNFLELTSGYKNLLYEKRKELGDSANKLISGLSKIVETREKVEQMSIEIEEKKTKAAKFQKECEDYLVILVGKKREADEEAKAVSLFQVKIQEEEGKCQVIAEAAQKELDEALPALEEAMKALDALSKKDIAEVKAYGKPPALVELVLGAVMVLKQSEATWAEAKRQLNDPNFINSLKEFDRDHIPDKVLRKINKYTSDPEFQPDKVAGVSGAAKSLCLWVRAMEMYGQIFRVVQPKRERYNQAMSQLKEKQDALAEAKRKLAEVNKQIEDLKQQYEEKMAIREKLSKEIEYSEMMLDRATRLISGLAGEKIRWEETVKNLESQIGYLIGDCLLAAAFLSYMGPFLSEYREELMEKVWLPQVGKLSIPCTPEFKFSQFLSKPTTVREWNIQGLPTDSFSTENGVIVTRGARWPLMVDPQAQAIKWVKNMERKEGLTVFDLQTQGYLQQLELCITMGRPCLCQNIKEDLDPSLTPVLTKSVKKMGGSWYLKLGDREVEYSKDFRFYMTTKLSNPNYSPEVSSKANIINFAVKEQGLEAQLLGIVVRNEKAELEEDKDRLVLSIAANKNKLIELEDQILKLLNETKGSLLDNVELVDTLEVSKQTSKEVTESVLIAEQNEVAIDAAREGYRPSAQRAAILFFVLNDLGKVDPMYQFSLDSYISLFNLSLEKSQKSPKLEERIEKLNDYHTFAVYRSTCRALFELHKLLFAFQMCVKIMEASGKINREEYQFFLKGGIVLDRENQMDNPCSWLSDQLWDNITELSKLANFHGIIESFEQYPRDWNSWFQSSEPEVAPLPGEWDSALNELQRMLIVRSLRPDRVSFCAHKFIVNNLGSKFVEPPVLDMKSVFDDSTSRSPLIFVLSPGVDPNKYLKELAEKCNMTSRFNSLSLGQGQAVVATKRIKEGAKAGYWVFLANCHLSLSWMPQLDKIVEQLQIDQVHKDFRLWLSSSPNPEFPIAILQSSIKITTEPPKGIKANTKRLYAQMTESHFNASKKPEKYKKLLFCLCFFHSILLERKKFLNLGWNINYSFNDSDFDMSEKILFLYLDMYEDTQWEALKYLIALVNYGGHVTDDWDMRLLQTYMNSYFKEEALVPFFKLSTLPTYYVPKDGHLNTYREFVNMMPTSDHPEAFGQHPNGDIASQIKETKLLFDTLLSLQPAVTSSTDSNKKSTEEEVYELSDKVLETLPSKIDYESTVKIFQEDNSPLKIVLLQEIERYNILLDDIYGSLISLQKGIQGLVVMSADLEEIFKCVFEGRVPDSWQKMYPSMKPLASWTRDLIQRVDQLTKWSETAHPPVLFWMSGFTFPTGFLTAVLQTTARLYNISVDSLSWEFTVMQLDDQYITTAPKDGVYIRGLFLEAAAWDKKLGCLIEAEPMQLVCSMPTILFKPVENKKKTTKGLYVCPTYYYPNRAYGSGRASFVVAVDLKTGQATSDHYVKRGTALLMSLDY